MRRWRWSTHRLRIVLSGRLTGPPHQGDDSWAVLQYLIGLRRLGHQVVFVEPVSAAGPDLADSPQAAYFGELIDWLGMQNCAALVDPGTKESVGLSHRQLRDVAGNADVFLNLCGVLSYEDIIGRVPIRAFVDLDPTFTQLWHEVEGIDMGFDRHNRFVTVGQALGSETCTAPTCGRSWIPTAQPIVLERWPVSEAPLAHDALTTVGQWRSHGSIEHDGVHYGQKAHSLQSLIDAPARADARFLLALGSRPDERGDMEALRRHGWELIDPDAVVGTPARYQEFVQRSWAEFGLAEEGYVASGCGWFSDRSVCYLASGRPVLAQDTGFGPYVPVGEGVMAFRTAEDVAVAVDELRSDYGRHRRAAREIAQEVFSSDRVLTRLLANL